MKKSGLASKIWSDVWRQAWVVNCQAVGTGANSIKYLAPYVFKVAISKLKGGCTQNAGSGGIGYLENNFHLMGIEA